jgi:hypothetical protein
MNYFNLNPIQTGLIVLCFIIEIVLVVIHRNLNYKLSELRTSGKIPDIIQTNIRKKTTAFMIVAVPILVVTIIKTF